MLAFFLLLHHIWGSSIIDVFESVTGNGFDFHNIFKSLNLQISITEEF